MASVLAPLPDDDLPPVMERGAVEATPTVRRPAPKSGGRTVRRVLTPGRPKGPLVGEKLLWQIRKPPQVHLAGLCLMVLGLVAIGVIAMLPLTLPVLASPQKLLPGWHLTYQPLLPMIILLATALGNRLAVIGLSLWLVAGLAGLPLFAAGGGLAVLQSPGTGYWLALLPVVWGVSTAMGWLFAKVTRPWSWCWICLGLGVSAALLWHGLGMIYGGLLAVATATPWPVLKSWWVGLSLWPLPYDLLLTAAAIGLTRLTRAALWPLLY